MELSQQIALVESQEELLQFDHFSSRDAWELGKIFAEEALGKEIPIAICIRTMSGKTLFHFTAEGSNRGSQDWIDRKFNTVQHFETSTLAYSLFLKKRGKTLSERGLDPTRFVDCGGGFPIVVRLAGLVGAVMVSGLTDLEDHDVLVRCISRYLGVENVPHYPTKNP
ncbi:heme-degrading domain-containing protein [uncultured Sphaerochaeta sp.]|uniref:heme-degrading domain-containing protein n=1 Tax=uncultured Sphaerochaeta sp. TaxID=886478 RepID=UPI002AA7EAD2|nr:heme-degrading domain-containing protein [uncultured Sphaerochaeta sp.]